ncbi:hypothetical protein DH09_10515 [Bacillaceae bacterium JMAK1]|nr:hypothetical protein DH09_10515 [Bacillaceae bacterium JMAK1]
MTEVQRTPDRDAEENMGLGIVAYILFFIPLLAGKDSPFARYHANQGLLLLILGIIVAILGSIPIIGTFIIGPIGSLFVLALFILGIVNAVQKKRKPLPVIGGIQIIK